MLLPTLDTRALKIASCHRSWTVKRLQLLIMAGYSCSDGQCGKIECFSMKQPIYYYMHTSSAVVNLLSGSR